MDQHDLQEELIDEEKMYVESFRGSSDRTRYALYIVILVSTIIAFANHNILPGNWPRVRLDSWFDKEPSTEREWLRRHEYLKEFVSRAVWTSSPIPGVSIDANDLGTVGGTALVALMFIVVLCLAREHENLYLALFKVRSLCLDTSVGGGRDAANRLYHALAMGQVIGDPPTLARWHRNYFFDFTTRAAYFVPILVQVWVVFTNWQTANAGKPYHVNMNVILFWQSGISAALLALTLVACMISRAMAIRWRRAFARVNPCHAGIPQMALRRWLWPKTGVEPRLEQTVRAGLVEKISPADDGMFVDIDPQTVDIADVLTPANVKQMIDNVTDAGKTAAWVRFRNAETEFTRFEVFTSVKGKLRWVVTGRWHLRMEPSSQQVEMPAATWSAIDSPPPV